MCITVSVNCLTDIFFQCVFADFPINIITDGTSGDTDDLRFSRICVHKFFLSGVFFFAGWSCQYKISNYIIYVNRYQVVLRASPGSFNCRFLVLSFSQVLILNICYVLKQNAEIFARFRSISQRILEKRCPIE